MADLFVVATFLLNSCKVLLKG